MNRVRIIDCPDYPEFIGCCGYVYDFIPTDAYPIKVSLDSTVTIMEDDFVDEYNQAEFKQSEVREIEI